MRLARVTELVEFDMEALVYLDEHGFVPGSEAVVVAQGPDGTLVLQVGDGTVVLGAPLAGQLYVATVAAQDDEGRLLARGGGRP